MRKRCVWTAIAVATVLLWPAALSAAEGADGWAGAPQVRGWSVGLGTTTAYGTAGLNDGPETLIGGRLGYWHEHFGFDASLHFSLAGLDATSDSSTVDLNALAVAAVGAKGGKQFGPAKWYGRLGVIIQFNERKFGSGAEGTAVFGGAELGAGVDFAVSERLILGLNLLDLRMVGGEFNSPGQDAFDVIGGRISVLSGGHISYQF